MDIDSSALPVCHNIMCVLLGTTSKNKKCVIRNALTKNDEMCGCGGNSVFTGSHTGVSSSVFLTDSSYHQCAADVEVVFVILTRDSNSKILDEANNRETWGEIHRWPLKDATPASNRTSDLFSEVRPGDVEEVSGATAHTGDLKPLTFESNRLVLVDGHWGRRQPWWTDGQTGKWKDKLNDRCTILSLSTLQLL